MIDRPTRPRPRSDEPDAGTRLLARALTIGAFALIGVIAFLLGSIILGIGVRVFLNLAGL